MNPKTREIEVWPQGTQRLAKDPKKKTFRLRIASATLIVRRT
jgi:hypothetical protein